MTLAPRSMPRPALETWTCSSELAVASRRGHSVLAVSDLPHVAFPRIRAAVDAGGASISVVSSLADLATRMERGAPIAVLVDLRMGDRARQTCEAVRAASAWARVAVIGLASEVSDLTFAEVLSWGGDDVVAMDSAHELEERLRALPRPVDAPTAPARGRAIIATADATTGILFARALRNAAYDVRLVDDEDSLQCVLSEAPAAVVVCDSAFGARGGAPLVRAARDAGVATPWVISTPPGRSAAVRAELRGLAGVEIHDAFACADDLLFVVNDLAADRRRHERAHARLLYGTRVWMRPAGGERDSLGYSFSVSQGGLFVRSLAPFETGRVVWLEVHPPRSERRVRLVATACWQRSFGASGGAVSPAGTGFRIEGGLPGDVEAYRAGCARLATHLGIDL